MFKVIDFLTDGQIPCQHHGLQDWVLYTMLDMTQKTRTYYLECKTCQKMYDKTYTYRADEKLYTEPISNDYKPPFNLEQIVGVLSTDNVETICDNLQRIFTDET